MIKAMESGTGSISTTHAADAVAAVRKLVTCAMEAGPHVTQGLATSKLAATVDLIVQLSMETKAIPGGAQGPGESRRSSPWLPARRRSGTRPHTCSARMDPGGGTGRAPRGVPDTRPARVRPRGVLFGPPVRGAAVTPLIPGLAGALLPRASSAWSSGCGRRQFHSHEKAADQAAASC